MKTQLLLSTLFAVVACNGKLDVGSTVPVDEASSKGPADPALDAGAQPGPVDEPDSGTDDTGPVIPPGPATYSVQGAINGAPFKPASAIAFRGEWVGGADYPDGTYLRVFFSDRADLNCDAFPSAPNSVTLRLELKEADARPTKTPLAATSHVLLDVNDATCEDSPAAPTSGSVTLTAVNGMVQGAVSATFSNGIVSGDFSIPVCPGAPSSEPLCQ